MVSMMVQVTGQNQLPEPSPMARAPKTMMMKERPRRAAPIAIFCTLVGSWLRAACQRQKMSKSGASAKMKKGLMDWNQVAGTWKPAMMGQTVFSSAQVCIVLPCCS